eukprot:TRINITY_DN12739_c0_g1_i1.p1 TRINITY_DN12739_c0_g1~~TRINITY_DN12739_c0_g1_i1.p1  ORF type:complete len:383 (+),score=-42.09 TRINITY_DN12739_c0_g1_i1:101-1150(+)
MNSRTLVSVFQRALTSRTSHQVELRNSRTPNSFIPTLSSLAPQMTSASVTAQSFPLAPLSVGAGGLFVVSAMLAVFAVVQLRTHKQQHVPIACFIIQRFRRSEAITIIGNDTKECEQFMDFLLVQNPGMSIAVAHVFNPAPLGTPSSLPLPNVSDGTLKPNLSPLGSPVVVWYNAVPERLSEVSHLLDHVFKARSILIFTEVSDWPHHTFSVPSAVVQAHEPATRSVLPGTPPGDAAAAAAVARGMPAGSGRGRESGPSGSARRRGRGARGRRCAGPGAGPERPATGTVVAAAAARRGGRGPRTPVGQGPRGPARNTPPPPRGVAKGTMCVKIPRPATPGCRNGARGRC